MIESGTRDKIWELLSVLEFKVVFSFGLKVLWVDIHLLAEIQKCLVLESRCLCAELLLKKLLVIILTNIPPLSSLVVL